MRIDRAVTTQKQTIDLIVKYRRTFTAGKAVLLAMMNSDLKEVGQCRVRLAKEKWNTVGQALALPKFSPIVPIFNQQYAIFS